MVLIAGTMWAGCGIAAQLLFAKSFYDAMDLTVFRMLFAGLILLAVNVSRGTLKKNLAIMKKRPKLWISLAFYGIVALMLMHYTYFAAIHTGNAAVATVLQYTSPALVILWVGFSERRIPPFGELGAVVLAVVGAFLLATGGDLGKFAVPRICIYFSALSALFYAICQIYPKHLMLILDNSFIIMVGMFIGGVSAWLVDPVTDFTGFFAPDIILESFWIVVCGTVIAFACYNAGLHYMSPDQAAVTSTIEPVVSVVASYFIFRVSFNIAQLIGIFLVIFAIVLPVLFPGRRRFRAKPQKVKNKV